MNDCENNRTGTFARSLRWSHSSEYYASLCLPGYDQSILPGVRDVEQTRRQSLRVVPFWQGYNSNRSLGNGPQGESNGDRTAAGYSRRVGLGRRVSRVRGDGGAHPRSHARSGRQQEAGRSAGDNDLPQWPPLLSADREPAALRVGRPISATPATWQDWAGPSARCQPRGVLSLPRLSPAQSPTAEQRAAPWPWLSSQGFSLTFDPTTFGRLARDEPSFESPLIRSSPRKRRPSRLAEFLGLDSDFSRK